MVKLPKNLLSAILFLAVIFSFHNCTQQTTQFSSETLPKIVDNITTQDNGSGGGYLGKPREGDYFRSFPTYKCGVQDALQGNLNVTSFVHIFTDNCNTTNIDFNFNNSVLDFSAHNQDYLGVGTAIYEYKSDKPAELPITEVWCQFKGSSTTKYDIVAKVNSTLANAQAKVYLNNNGALRVTTPLAVSRSTFGSVITFSSGSLNLQVQKSAASDQFSMGHAQMLVDSVLYEQDVICRVADVAPIEEMGTGLSNLFPRNTFIADGQEALCGQPGVISCDNLEDRVSIPDLQRTKFVNIGWSYQPGAYTISNIAYDGTKALEMPTFANGTGSGNIGVNYNSSSEIYARFYIKWSANFVFSPTTTGLMSISGPVGGLFVFDSARNLIARNGINNYPTTFSPIVNQWYCLEVHLKSASSAGANNGIMEMWANDNKILGMNNYSPVGTMNDFGYYGNWYCADSDNNNVCDSATHPAQSVYLDNIVVARQRVGCF